MYQQKIHHKSNPLDQGIKDTSVIIWENIFQLAEIHHDCRLWGTSERTEISGLSYIAQIVSTGITKKKHWSSPITSCNWSRGNILLIDWTKAEGKIRIWIGQKTGSSLKEMVSVFKRHFRGGIYKIYKLIGEASTKDQ